MAIMTREQETLSITINEKLADNRARLNQWHSSTDEQEKASLSLEIEARSQEIRTLQAYFRSLRVSSHRRYNQVVNGYAVRQIA